MASSSDRSSERSRRRPTQAMATQGGKNPPPSRQPRSPARISLPKNRLFIGSSLALLVIIAGIIAAPLFRSESPAPLDNAIWLGKSWTYANRDESEITDLAAQLQQRQIGKVYAYVSTLNISSRWSGGPAGNDSFMHSQDDVMYFRETFKQAFPQSEIYGWIEIWTTPGLTGEDRFGAADFRENVAEFSSIMVDELGFDGVFLDVKPLFGGDGNFVQLIRHVRSAVGLDVPIAVALSPDLTPPAAGLAAVPGLAPGAMWAAADKQQVMAAVDEIVLQVYQSYRDDPVDYINWAAYHVETYASLSDADTRILISIPHYQGNDGHDPAVETIAAALDGVNIGLSRLDEQQQAALTGVAIYADQDLGQEQWEVYSEKWLTR